MAIALLDIPQLIETRILVAWVGREHLTWVALTLNPSPNSGRGTSILPPFSHPPRSPLQGDGSGGFAVFLTEKGLGDEGDFPEFRLSAVRDR
jgi:hypothetical protein